MVFNLLKPFQTTKHIEIEENVKSKILLYCPNELYSFHDTTQ